MPDRPAAARNRKIGNMPVMPILDQHLAAQIGRVVRLFLLAYVPLALALKTPFDWRELAALIPPAGEAVWRQFHPTVAAPPGTGESTPTPPRG